MTTIYRLWMVCSLVTLAIISSWGWHVWTTADRLHTQAAAFLETVPR